MTSIVTSFWPMALWWLSPQIAPVLEHPVVSVANPTVASSESVQAVVFAESIELVPRSINICAGDTVLLYAYSTNPSDVLTWDPAPGLTPLPALGNARNVYALAVPPADFSQYTVRDFNGERDTVTVNTDFNFVVLQDIIGITDFQQFCANDTARIIRPGVPGFGEFTIEPQPANGWFNNGDGTRILDPSVMPPGEYTVTYDNTRGQPELKAYFGDFDQANSQYVDTIALAPGGTYDIDLFDAQGQFTTFNVRLFYEFSYACEISEGVFQRTAGGSGFSLQGFHRRATIVMPDSCILGTLVLRLQTDNQPGETALFVTRRGDVPVCSDFAVETFRVLDPSFTGLDSLECVLNEQVYLQPAWPSGDFYAFPDVPGAIGFDGSIATFNPSLYSPGTQVTVSYVLRSNAGCLDTFSLSTTVTGVPSAAFSGLQTRYCGSDDPSLLTPAFASGTFTASPAAPGAIQVLEDGVYFDPAAYPDGAGVTVTYIADAGAGCTDTVSMSTQVFADIPVSFSGLKSFYCSTEPLSSIVGSPPNGLFYTTAPSGIIESEGGAAFVDPGQVPPGTYEI